jgi:hypothetical protein
VGDWEHDIRAGRHARPGARVAILQQVEDSDSAADLLLGDRDHQAQVRDGHLLAGVAADADKLRLSAGELHVECDLGIVAHALEWIGVAAAHDPELERPEGDRLALPSQIARRPTLSREWRLPLWIER